MNCYARLVRAMLGPEAIAADKLMCGRSLVVLGVQLQLNTKGLKCKPEADKKSKCLLAITEALTQGVLHAGTAQKLSGRLSWAVQYMFFRVGRAMLRPIFNQKFSR